MTPTPQHRPFSSEQQSRRSLTKFVQRAADERARASDEYAAKWTVAKRMQALHDGDALPGTPPKFPIKDQADLNNAHGLIGNSSVPDGTLRAHIRRMALKHGLKIPSSMGSTS